MSDQLAERDGGSVGPRRDESSQDGLAESGIGPSGKELEELHTNRPPSVMIGAPLTLTSRC